MKNDTALIQELFEIPRKAFQQHLEISGNYRIIFSGKYGIGKTTFLSKHFFSKENKESEKKYNKIHLFPVNYSVSNNADILVYIKYDIASQLLGEKAIDLEKIDVSYFKTLPYFLLHKPADVVAPFLHFLEGTGKVYEGLTKILKEADEFHHSVNIDDRKALITYLSNAQNTKGSIYESDFFSNLIRKLLDQWKGDSIENVLIIDDLDRIDPHHIFRLFNVFAAHFDAEGDAADEEDKTSSYNKFGFDKVIFVCDIDNIRQIFKSNYGANVDFNGYIDKFYSKKVFKFDNRESVQGIIKPLVEVLNFVGTNEDNTNFLNMYNPLKYHIIYILSNMWRAGAINLRSLIKFRRETNEILLDRNVLLKFTDTRSFYSGQQLIITTLDVIHQFCGSTEEMTMAFDQCEKFTKSINEEAEEYNYMLERIVAYLGYSNSVRSGEEITYPVPEHEVDIVCKLYDYTVVKNREVKMIDAKFQRLKNKPDSLPWLTTKPNIFYMHNLVLKKLIDYGYF